MSNRSGFSPLRTHSKPCTPDNPRGHSHLNLDGVHGQRSPTPTPHPGQARSFPASASLAWVKRPIGLYGGSAGWLDLSRALRARRGSSLRKRWPRRRELQAGSHWVGRAPGLPSHAQRLLPAGQHFRGKKEQTPNHKTFLLPRGKAIHPRQSPKRVRRNTGLGEPQISAVDTASVGGALGTSGPLAPLSALTLAAA